MDRSAATRRVALVSLLLLAFVGTVTGLNVTLYSATGFVSSYLHALSRHDSEGALAMPGVTMTDDASKVLLASTALPELSNIHLISDAAHAGGHHTVVFGYTVAGQPGRTSFSVQHSGPRFGVFSSWRFSRSPVTTLTITPLHGQEFRANSIDITTKASAGTATDYLVFAPTAVELSYRSEYFVAPKAVTVVDSTTEPARATVDIEANRTFVAEVQKELDAHLKECVTQQVLLPTGCPMGKQITDRIQNDPVWSMVSYPKISIRAGDTEGSWLVPETEGTAHLVVQVKSIFDGKLSTFDSDVPFTVSYEITFPNNQLTITAKY
jgi:hypothetical protein